MCWLPNADYRTHCQCNEPKMASSLFHVCRVWGATGACEQLWIWGKGLLSLGLSRCKSRAWLFFLFFLFGCPTTTMRQQLILGEIEICPSLPSLQDPNRRTSLHHPGRWNLGTAVLPRVAFFLLRMRRSFLGPFQIIGSGNRKGQTRRRLWWSGRRWRDKRIRDS